MHNTMTRLYEAAAKLGLSSPTDIASKLNESQQVVNNWERRGISKRGAIKAQEAFGCSATWILTGDGILLSSSTDNLKISAESNTEIAPDMCAIRMIPIVGEVQGGMDGHLAELAYPVGHGDGCVAFPAKDKNAYALRVRGDSMHPRYRVGEFVIVEPSIEPPPGEDVIVICRDGRKMLKMLNWIRDDEVQFVSINNDYAPLTMLLSEIESIQLVSGKVSRLGLIRP